MRRPDSHGGPARAGASRLPAARPAGAAGRGRWAAACAGALGAAMLLSAPRAEPAEGAAYRHQAPIVVEQAAPYVRLPLTVGVYAHSRQPGLADLRIVDARGDRVPFALLAPRPARPQEGERLRPATLYPLPPVRAGEAEPRSPIEVQVVGERIVVRRQAAATVAPAAARPAPGWLFDLGERPRGDGPAAAPSALRLAWSAPAEFSAAYELAVSDDLRRWRAAGGGQLLALESATGRLTQPNVPLPPGDTARFVRLRWFDPAQAPTLTAAQQVHAERQRVVLDPPATLVLQPLAGPEAGGGGTTPGTSGAAPAPGALHYDLGAALPVLEVDLALPSGLRVAPVRVQGRARADEAWRDLGQTVFYRLERGGAVDRPPPLPVHATVRQLRLVPDPRSGALPAVPLTVQAQLSSIVFAAQGQPPYRLLAGSAEAAPGALPIGTLVPALEEERPRLGRAALGDWSENEAVARQEAWRQRVAGWRPILLWAVLLAGVLALGAMVWRLARRPSG